MSTDTTSIDLLILHNNRHAILLLVCLFLLPNILPAQQFFPVKKDKKWGLIDTDGNIVVEPNYEAIGEFKHFGYAVMQRQGGVGLLDQNTNEVIRPRYEDIKVLDEDLVAVMDEGQWMVINFEEEIILEKGYTRVNIWEGEYLAFLRDNMWGIALKDGTVITEPAYEGLRLMDNGYFETQVEDGVGLLSPEGLVLIPPKYKEVKIISDNLFLFKDNRRWGGVDGSGREVFDASFDSFQKINEQFIVLVSKNLKFLYSDKARSVISKDEYSGFYDFSETQILTKKQRRLGLIEDDGTLVLEAKYHEIHAYAQDLYRVNYEGSWGIVSKNDVVVIPFEYDYIAPSKNNVCAAKKGAKWTAINMDGEELIEAKYEQISIEDELIRATINGALELFAIDEEGNIVDENKLENHFTIRIGGNSQDNRRIRGAFGNTPNRYLLKNFEWFYAPKEDKWGLRKLSDGEIQIKPTYNWIVLKAEYGYTMAFIEKTAYQRFDKTEMRTYAHFGLVNNEVGKLTTLVNLLDIRFRDFEEGAAVARVVFVDGRQGLISKKGKVVKKNQTYIGNFKDGLARFSQKGKLSVKLKGKKDVLEPLEEYCRNLESSIALLSYTQTDRDLYNEGNLWCQGCVWGYVDTLGNEIVQAQYDYARDFKSEIGIVRLADKWGVLGMDGKVLMPFASDNIGFLDNTEDKILKISMNRERYGLIDTLGQVTVDLLYDELGEFVEDRLAVRKGNKWGFVDKYGREVIPCIFTKVNNFSQGYATVKLGTKWGLVDKLGDTQLPFEYGNLGNHSEGLVWFRGISGRGYMDVEGNVVIEPKFSQVDDFENGVASVKYNGQFGLIDTKGDYILRPKYVKISPFNKEGIAIAKRQANRIKYEVIDRRGTVLTQHAYRDIQNYSEGYAAVRLKDYYGFIDSQGKLVIDNVYSKVSDFSDGLASVQLDGKCGYINKAGEVAIPFEFSKCLDFQDGKAVVYNGYRKAGLIDQSGDFLIKPGLNRLMDFNDGRGLVRDEKYRYYYITEQAKLYDGFYDSAGSFRHGVAVVKIEGLWGVINQKGIEIVPPKYDKIENFEDGYAKVRIKEFSGLSNLNGETIVSPDYEYISYAGEGIFRVEQGDMIGYFDRSGKWIWGLQE